jgi:hypothetical protein
MGGKPLIRVGLMLSMLLLLGCVRPCSETDVIGEYEIRSEGDVFTLELRSGAVAKLSKNGRLVGSFSWSLLSDDRGVALDVPRDVGDAFRRLGKRDQPPAGVAAFTQETYVVHPECSRGRGALRVPLTADGDISFARK